MDFSYYPGCSGHGTAIEQDLSTRAVCDALGVSLHELPDWSCCGASAAHAIGGDLVVKLGARNLCIAEEAGRDVVVPCAACFGNLRAAAHHLREGDRPAETEVPGRLMEILPLSRLLATPELEGRIRSRCGRGGSGLAGLRVAPYYGCLLVRPPEVTGVDDPEDPREIDRVAAACGARVVRWSYKTVCCGGSLSVSHPGLVSAMSLKLVEMAARAGADCLVTACPMCHANLDTQQWRRRRAAGPGGPHRDVPVLYLTELVGLALGLPGAEGWLKRHLVDPRPALAAAAAPAQEVSA